MRVLLAILFCAMAGASYASSSPSSAVVDYLEDFNRGLPAEELVQSYWHPSAMIVTPGGVLSFQNHQDSKQWLEGIQAEISRNGWIRSDLVESAVCPLGDTVALFSMKFKRVFADGSETFGGGTYTMLKSDRWRIVVLTFVDPKNLVRCD
jgi:hypothetical protein